MKRKDWVVAADEVNTTSTKACTYFFFLACFMRAREL